MLQSKIIILFILVFSMPTFATGKEPVNRDYLYGNWICKHEVVDVNTKMKVKVNYQVNFSKTGKSNGFGALFFNLANLPELEYSLSDKSTWEIKGDQLHLSSTEVKSENVSYPELDKFLNLNKLIPKQINESAKILTLTKSNLKVKSESNGDIYSCAKKVVKS